MSPVSAERAGRIVAVDAYSVGVSVWLPSVGRALRGLATQPSLPLPACYLLDARGRPALRAEVPRVAPLPACKKLAHEALDAALARARTVSTPGSTAAASAPPASPDADAAPVAVAAFDAAALEAAARDALEQTGFPFERAGPGFAVHVDGGAAPSTRVEVSRGEVGLRARIERSLRLATPSCLHAMARYALELNHRLRFARVAVDGTAFDVAHVVWDAVLPEALPLARTLGGAIEAVAVARAVSNDVFTALADERVAQAYLRLRFADDASLAPPARTAPVRPPTPRAYAALPGVGP